MKQNNRYKIVACFTAFCILMTVAGARIYTVGKDTSQKVDLSAVNSYVFEYKNARGTIYDCNGKPLTDDTLCYYKIDTNGKTPRLIQESSDNGKAGDFNFTCTKRYSDSSLARHIIGYVNAENRGVTGIEKAFDDILKSDAYFKVSVPKRADGKITAAAKPEFINAQTGGSVYLTIDKDIQLIAENNCKDIQKGAVVVSEIASGKIRALASFPNFEQNDVSKSLTDNYSPLLNRALAAYSVGSVFKPCIAVCAIESGLSGYTTVCKGNMTVEGHIFNCHKLDGHGNMNIKNAVAQSCNTYFYGISQNIEPTLLYNKAARFGFGGSMELCRNIKTSCGSLPSIGSLQNSKRTVANFAIGQGALTASPINLCNLYNAIAGGGEYHQPSIIEKTVKDGKTEYIANGKATKVTKIEVADTVKEGLREVVLSGTGKAAASDFVNLCGKTATAQTGQTDEKGERLNLWFCGFFPYENPIYTVVILKEGVYTGASS
ncbi:MAG: penicillin-binding protein 2, partial [Oscillospiraceae bacterium]|nr:penicillin-binding protein 2 [Candidatus Equicaccousia limihippi]